MSLHDSVYDRYAISGKNISQLASDGETDLIKALLKAYKIPTDILNGCLIAAAKCGHTDTMELFRANGVTSSATYSNAFVVAAGNGHIDAMEALKIWGATTRDTAFSTAAYSGQTESMRRLARWGGVSIPAYNTAFIAAAYKGRIDALKLLKKWETPSIKPDYNRAFVSAEDGGQVETMNLLVKWGASASGIARTKREIAVENAKAEFAATIVF